MNRCCLLMLIVLSVAGCQQSLKTDYDKLDIASVTGNVTMDGQPLVGAYIKFEGEDLTYSFGKTDSGGNYSLMLNSEKDGILPGEKKVMIRSTRAFGAEGAMLDGQSAGEAGEGEVEDGGETEDGTVATPKPKKQDVHENYHSKTKLKATVTSGIQVINFALKSDGSTDKPE